LALPPLDQIAGPVVFPDVQEDLYPWDVTTAEDSMSVRLLTGDDVVIYLDLVCEVEDARVPRDDLQVVVHPGSR
jgi:hypothetical protein